MVNKVYTEITRYTVKANIKKKNHISSVLRLDFKLNSIDAVHFNFCFRKHSLLIEVYVKQFGKFLKKRGM